MFSLFFYVIKYTNSLDGFLLLHLVLRILASKFALEFSKFYVHCNQEHVNFHRSVKCKVLLNVLNEYDKLFYAKGRKSYFSLFILEANFSIL